MPPSFSSGGEPNPYAPPAAEITPSQTPPLPVERMKRPASQIWTLILFGVVILTVIQHFRSHGLTWYSLEKFRAEPLDFLTRMTAIPAFITVLWPGRLKTGYWLGSIALALYCWRSGTENVATFFEAPTFNQLWNHGEDLLIAGLHFYIFYRFVFGRPNREYFRF